MECHKVKLMKDKLKFYFPSETPATGMFYILFHHALRFTPHKYVHLCDIYDHLKGPCLLIQDTDDNSFNVSNTSNDDVLQIIFKNKEEFVYLTLNSNSSLKDIWKGFQYFEGLFKSLPYIETFDSLQCKLCDSFEFYQFICEIPSCKSCYSLLKVPD